MKETILKAFDEIHIVKTRDFTTEEKDKEVMAELLNNILIPYKKAVRAFLSKSYDQVRTDTIKEVEEMLPLYDEWFLPPNESMECRKTRNDTIKEIRDALNQLKK